ncbi:hypothetical protein L7F22_014034 [Adiantum nelumboides]|nr:hypothetical protein [Adiantum nelumboides]
MHEGRANGGASWESPCEEESQQAGRIEEAEGLSPLRRTPMELPLLEEVSPVKSAKHAWDILAGLYPNCNEAKIALLRKELESKIMNEENDMDTFLAGVKDINEQLIFLGEVFKDSSLVQIVLDDFPELPHPPGLS